MPSLQSPGEGGGSETQSRARGCRRSVQSGANATAGGRAARRRSDAQSSRRASRARGDDETKQTRGCQQRTGAGAGRRSPAKRATRHLRETPTRQRVMRLLRKRKATRSSARATGGAEASTSGGGAWGVRFALPAAQPRRRRLQKTTRRTKRTRTTRARRAMLTTAGPRGTTRVTMW